MVQWEVLIFYKNSNAIMVEYPF